MLVSPSMLSADFANLGRDLDMINESSADMLHLDVMDGVFVPNISFGFPVIERVSQLCRKPLDVHLMIVEPQKYISRVRDCGASIMTVHYEACTHLNRAVQQIHAAGMKAGVALNPSTPVAMLNDIVRDVDLVLLMSVNPGFGGQSFLPGTTDKLAELADLLENKQAKPLIEVDGGINFDTGKAVAEAKADILVAGSFVFKSTNPTDVIDKLRNL